MVTLVPMALLHLASGIGELLDWLLGAVAGWRYVFSPSYRRRTHARWRDEAWIYIAFDVICAAVACAFSLFLLAGLIRVFAGSGWWPRLFD